MLQQMRENTKTILWIVVIAFVISIFAVWGMDLRSGRGGDQSLDTDVIGSVDGVKITRQMYSSAYQEIYNQIRAQRGENVELSVTEKNMLNEQAWETLVMEILRSREIERLGITVSDNELVAFLRQNPPPVLQQAFVDEQGRFDYQAYLRELANPQRDWTALEQWGRSQLPRMKFETMLMSQIFVPERAILEKFVEQTVEIRARYLKVPYVEENPPFTPDDKQLRDLYEETKEDEFKEFEKRSVRLIMLPIEPTAADERDVLEQLLEVKKEIDSGTDFAEAARLHSDDYSSAENGGDLGFFAKGALDSTFTAVAFRQAAGQISGPVRTSYGYHLIRTEEKKTENGEEQVRASHILMKVEPGYDTTDSLSTLIRELDEAIRNEGFEKGAASKGITPVDTEPFIKGVFIQGFGYQPRIVNFAFGHEPGKVSSAIYDENASYFVKILEVIPETTRPFERVRDLLIEKVRFERKVSNAEKIAESIRQEAGRTDLETAARARGFEVQETPPFRIADEIPGIGTGTNFAAACDGLQAGRISAPVKGQNEWYVIKIVSRSGPDMNQFAGEKNRIRDELMQQASYDFMSDWYAKMREAANVVDNREETID